jgi:hypothetical protein
MAEATHTRAATDRGWFAWARGNSPPDFEQTVKVVLTTFTAFTGFTVNKAVESVADQIKLPTNVGDRGTFTIVWDTLDLLGAIWSSVHFWALIALLSLLLRYLIGSAIHLNDTYVKRVGETKPALSQSTLFLFKDLVFLVLFGIVVLTIARTVKGNFQIAPFLLGCKIFLLCGLAWSVVDIISRYLLSKACPAWWGREWLDLSAYGLWPFLDLSQLLFTFWVSSWTADELPQTRWLALVYFAFLFVDVCYLILRLRRPAVAA